MIRFPTSLFTRPALFIYAGIGITLATTGVTVASLYEMRLDAMAQARVAAQNLVISLQKEIERNLDIYQLAMRDVATSAETPSIIRLPRRSGSSSRSVRPPMRRNWVPSLRRMQQAS